MIRPEDIKGNDEHSEQVRLFAWSALARQQYPQLKWLHAIPNANSHRQIAEGVRGGVADIFLPHSKYAGNTSGRIEYCGLYIEMKTEKRREEKNGGLSDEQLEFGRYALLAGYQWWCCYGWEEAKQKIEEYING